MNSKPGSEFTCAWRMYRIAQGANPLGFDEYRIDEVADRYGVTPDSVYRGIRKGSPLYPSAFRRGAGPKAWLYVTRAALEACDIRRIAFYKTTPSWLKHDGLDGVKPPKRVSARVLLGPAT